MPKAKDENSKYYKLGEPGETTLTKEKLEDFKKLAKEKKTMTGADLSPEQTFEADESVKQIVKSVTTSDGTVEMYPMFTKSSNWTDRRGTEEYTQEVLSWLNPEKEVIKGLPTTRGLRRFVKCSPDYDIYQYMGKSVYNVAQPSDNPDQALRGSVCEFHIEVELPNGKVESWGGIGEAFADNIDNKNIRKFPCSTAETRAEGRALTKLLGLNVLVLEELGSEADATQFEKEDQVPAVDVQWTKFDRMFQMHNINARQFFNMYASKAKITDRISKMNKGQARTLLYELNTFQQGSGVPTELLGYDKKWLKDIKEASK
jgi:hypothetical protein